MWKIIDSCGFKNKEAFRRKMNCELTHQQATRNMEIIINEMPDHKTIEFKKSDETFSFSDSQKSLLTELFTEIEDHIMKETPQPAPKSKYRNLSTANIQAFLNERVANSIYNLTSLKFHDFPIARSFTENFPWKLYVRCINCSEERLITVNESVKSNHVYRNIRASSYATHLKKCILKNGISTKIAQSGQ
jgi:hypothetical protein